MGRAATLTFQQHLCQACHLLQHLPGPMHQAEQCNGLLPQHLLQGRHRRRL
jgi:hypothetical protein